MTTTSSNQAPASATPALVDVVVVPHTHWDREWYRTFQDFRMRLVEAVDRVIALLEAGTYPHFLLDGQTIVLEDYLAIRPEMRDRLTAQVASGRLGVGPWYILPDEFLISGEAVLRNLQIGLRLTEKYGGTATIGYLPDMFGHLAQMPQILAGMGLHKAVVWRGVLPEKEHFVWRAPSGDAVAATYMPDGYCNLLLWNASAQRVGKATGTELPWLSSAREFFGRFTTSPVLLPTGCDHLAPRPDLPEIVARTEAAMPGYRMRIGSLEEALPAEVSGYEISGELRSMGRDLAYVLPDVISTRMYLKQANAEGQILLERVFEPLAALSHATGGEAFEGFWHEAWQLLLQNQPHDSICGCSIDEVHQEMGPRFTQVRAIANGVADRVLRAFARPEPGATAFNGTGWARSPWIEVVVDVPRTQAEGTASTGTTASTPVHLTDGAGRPVPAVLLSTEDTEEFYADIDFLAGWQDVRRHRFLARPDFAPFGFERLLLAEGAADPVEPAVTVEVGAGGTARLENDRVRVQVEDGAIGLVDKVTGTRYPNALRFEDTADAGDEYNWSPPERDEAVASTLTGVRLLEQTPVLVRLEVRHRLDLPVGLTEDRCGRATARVATEVVSVLTLRAGSALLEVATTLDNQAEDHRLRVLVGTGVAAADRPEVVSDNPFAVQRRQPTTSKMPLPVPKAREFAATTFPQQLFTAAWPAGRPEAGLVVANRGLPEAEVVSTPDGWAIAVTLLRCVGWLSRDDLRTRGGGAGPHVTTPEAQCRGMHTFHYALAPGAWEAALPEVHAFNAPPVAISTGGHLASVCSARDLPGPWLSVGHDSLVVSAVKKALDADALIVRVYNPTDRAIAADLAVRLPDRAVWEADLAERRGVRLGEDEVRVTWGPYQIRTFWVG